MQFLWVRARAFVHATEDEDRVRAALLWELGQEGIETAADRVERRRLKGHYGNDIIILEAALKSARNVREALGRILGATDVRSTLDATLPKRLDEDNVLHVRLDKQAAVEGRVELHGGSDSIVVRIKAVATPGERPNAAWHAALASS